MHPDNEHERLTNVRYAADIFLFGKSISEVVKMLEVLVEVLQHKAKAKVRSSPKARSASEHGLVYTNGNNSIINYNNIYHLVNGRSMSFTNLRQHC